MKNCIRTILFMAASVAAAQAGMIAVLPGTGGFENANWNSDTTLGWRFSLSTPYSVTHLGFFDAGGDGLADPHAVGIWDAQTNLLGSAIVPAGTAGELIDGFRFVAVTPFLLTAGDYVIGAYGNATSPDRFRFMVTGSTTLVGLTLGIAVQGPFDVSELTFPGALQLSGASEGYFGPNFLAVIPGEPGPPDAIPEPATLGLVGLALLGFVAHRRSRA